MDEKEIIRALVKKSPRGWREKLFCFLFFPFSESGSTDLVKMKRGHKINVLFHNFQQLT